MKFALSRESLSLGFCNQVRLKAACAVTGSNAEISRLLASLLACAFIGLKQQITVYKRFEDATNVFLG